MTVTPGRRWTPRLAVLAGLALLTGCATTSTTRIPSERGLIATNRHTAQELGAPRVGISTEYEYSAFRRVRTRLKVDDDAYVLVVNVAPDGLAQVIFPESPGDPGLLKGGKSYLLPVFFGGYPSMSLESATVGTRFGIVRQSALASPTLRGPGYTLVLASRTPFDMRRLELEGLFDGVELGWTTRELDPDEVLPVIAEIALPVGEPFIVSADHARYAGYDPLAGSRMSSVFARGNSAYCRYNSWDAGYFGIGVMRAFPSPFDCNDLPTLYRPPVIVDIPQRPDSTADSTSAPDSTAHPLTRRPPGTTRFRPAESPVTTTEAVELTTDARRRMLRDSEYTRRLRRDGLIEPGRTRLRDFDRARTGTRAAGTEADAPSRRTRDAADGVRGSTSGRIDRSSSRRSEPTRSVPRSEPSPRTTERSVPTRSEPVRPEPSRSEPTRSEPVRPAPVRSEPTRSEPTRSEPSRTTEPVRTPRQQ